MRPAAHLICTLTISGLVYLVFKSAVSFFASLVSGVLIDIDHILDYYLQQGITLKIRNIYLWSAQKKFKLVFLFLHSLELVFLLWGTIFIFKLGIFWLAVAIGVTQHMVLDFLFNRDINIYGYFLTFRIIKGFKKESILK